MKNLLKFKIAKKAKNPKFLRQDSYKKKKLSKSWRKARGWDSKQRKRMQRQAIVEPGYGSPKALRGLHKTGLSIVHVKSAADIKGLNPKEQGVILSRKLGLRKRIGILKELIKNKFTLLNIKNPDSYLKNKEEYLESRKQKGVEKHEEKKEVVAKESIEDKLSDEEKKKLEKKEIDRLLTKKF
jgi:large subunit ribosomal protein L32e